MITLKKGESTVIKLSQGKLDIFLGSKNNHIVIALLSPWYNFKDKDKLITQRYYVYDPRSYGPDKPTSRARKIIGDGEKLTLGSIRNQLYFSEVGHWDTKLSPEHLQIELTGSRLHFICLSPHNVEINHER